MGAGDRRRAGRRGAATAAGRDPFSLGDAEATARILERAGFDDIRFEDVREPVFYGHDLDAALAIVLGFQSTSAALASLSDGEAARTVERLRETLAAHYSDERGVALDSRSWLITALHKCSIGAAAGSGADLYVERLTRFVVPKEHHRKEAAHGLTGPEDVRLARRLRRTNRREHRLGRRGTLR